MAVDLVMLSLLCSIRNVVQAAGLLDVGVLEVGAFLLSTHPTQNCACANLRCAIHITAGAAAVSTITTCIHTLTYNDIHTRMHACIHKYTRTYT